VVYPLANYLHSTFNLAIILLQLKIISNLLCFVFSPRLDTFLAGSGIRWLYPFTTKAVNMFSKKTNNYHGQKWLKIYKKTVIWKIEILALAVLLIIFFLVKN